MRVWLLAPVRDRMGGERPCPSTGTPWAASRTASTVTWWLLPDVLVRVIVPFTTIPLAWLWVHSLLPRGSADLQRIAVCSTPSSGGLHRRCGREALLTTLPTRRFSWRTTGSALASPCLLSLRFCRQPERGAVLQRVPHCLLQCDEPPLHRSIRDCCRKEQPEAPCRLPERGACGATDRADALLRWSADPEGRGPAREGGQGVTQPAVWWQDLHGWSGHDDAGYGGCASSRRTFVLFCAWV